MFKGKQHYRDSLHLLLQKYSDGLPLAEISDVLKITDDDCRKLVAEEEVRGTLDVRFDGASIPLYISKRKISPSLSTSEISDASSGFKYLLLLGITLIFLCLLWLNGLSHKSVQNTATPSKVDVPEYVEAKISARKVAKYKSERSDLESRVFRMESQKVKCYKNWLESESCYITNRLLTEAEFERELAEIKFEISRLNELISLYNS
jgi:hypothetical protein